VRCLHSLSRTVQRTVPTFTGPYLDSTFNAGNNLSAPMAAVSLSPPAAAPPPPKPRALSPAPSSASIAASLRSQPAPVPSTNQHGLNSTSALVYRPNAHVETTPAPAISQPASVITSSAPSIPPPKPPKPVSTPAPAAAPVPTSATATSAYGTRGAGFGLDAELAKKQVISPHFLSFAH
jgi:hypothetical protein